jgi:ParB family chromosome partitioning protein
MKLELLPKKAIKIGTRHRSDEGDLDQLAASIADVGLLQPIATDEYYNLICGYRRARCWFEVLKREDPIPAVILNLKSILAGEFAENEFRKNFTKSERIAIGKALEAEAGERRGRPGQESPADSETLKNVHSGAHFPKGEKTRDIAAKVAGFKSHQTYEQAKKVINSGTPELTAAMDKGEVSVSAAAKLASKPPAEQRRILAMPKDERRTALARASEIKAQREDTADMHLFMSFSRAVALIAAFTVDGPATWIGVNRHYIPDFPEKLEKAISCLLRIREANPEEVELRQLRRQLSARITNECRSVLKRMVAEFGDLPLQELVKLWAAKYGTGGGLAAQI